MDILFAAALLVGLILRSMGRKKNNKSMEQAGNIIAIVSALIVTVLWIQDCSRALPQ